MPRFNNLQALPERRDLIETDPVALIHRAIENAKPLMNLVSVTLLHMLLCGRVSLAFIYYFFHKRAQKCIRNATTLYHIDSSYT